MKPSETRGMGVFILLVAMIPLVMVMCPAEEEEPEVVPTASSVSAADKPSIPDPVPLQPQATWTIRGKVLFDPDLHTHGPMVGEFPREEGGRKHLGWEYVEEDGSYAFERISGGSYRLKVGDMDRPPLYETGIELGPEGGELVIPEIDLRAITRRIQINVVDEDGLQPNFVVVKNLDVYVSAEDCRQKLVKDARGSIQVQLEPGIPLRLHIGNYPSLPEGWASYVTLAPLDLEGGPNRQGATLFPLESEDYLLRLPRPGQYRLILEFADISNLAGGIRPIGIPDTTPEETTITLMDQEEPQDFRFSLTDEQRSYIKSKVR